MKPSIFFHSIDGSPLGRRPGDIELLPGRHVIEFAYARVTWWSNEYSTENVRLVLDAVAGHEYEARASELPSPTVWLVLVGGRTRWGGSIVDLQSGAVVAGVGSPEPPTSAVTDTVSTQ